VVILTNADRGGQLAYEVLRTIAHAYGWPDYGPLQRSVVPLSDADFAKFTGYYQPPNAPPGSLGYFHIYRDGSHFYSQITGQQPVEIFAESPSEFFASIVAAEISFDIGPAGEVDGLVLHQNARQMPWHKVSTQVAEGAIAKLQQRIKDNVPSPGTEAAIRHQIETLGRDEPDYNAMGPQLAQATRAQLPQIKDMFEKLGPLNSLTFTNVRPNGADLYFATFAHGHLECTVAPLSPDGKLLGDFFHIVP
jgi:hypothetical protein